MSEEIKPITSRSAAVALAKSLVASGLREADVGQELGKRGWLSKKTGKPLTQGGVNALLRRQRSRHVGATVAASKPKRGGDPSLRLNLVRSICEQIDMDADDRLAAISLLVN